MRLRARLLCLITAALLPAFAVQIDFEREARQAREAAQREEALRLVRLVAADLESVVEGARQFLSAIANLDAVATGDAEACGRTLAGLSRDVPRYTVFSVLDAAGTIDCSVVREAVGWDLSHTALVQRAQASGEFTIGNYAVGLATRKHSLHVALPLKASRHGRDGMVVAALDLAWLAQRLAEVPLPPGGSAVVVDRNGTILGRWPDPERFLGTPASFQDLGSNDVRVDATTGIDGVRRIYAFGPLGGRTPGLQVGIGIDPAAAEAALARANRRGLLLIVLSGIAALLLASFAARRFLEQPVEALVTAMERWRAGDRTVRALADPHLRGLRARTEFGRIAAAFDQATAAVEAREAALRESEARFRQIAEALDDALVIVEPRRRRLLYASPAFARLFSLAGDPLQHRAEAFLDAVHPEDRATVRGLISHAPDQPFDAEYRVLRPDGAVRRVRHRRFPVQGSATGRVVGLITDVTEEREAAERQALLAREVDHRAKNVLTVVQSILRLTKADSPRAFTQAVEGRVAALARAHQLLSRSRWGGADLIELLREEFAPYAAGAKERTRGARRFLLQGPPLHLRPEAVQPIAMVVHELATNSAKHGALSLPGGTVRVTWEVDARLPDESPWLRLRWEEAGGPRVAAAPTRFGFGSRVVSTTVERQLGGEVRYDWDIDGLRCRIAVPIERLMSPPEEEPEALRDRPVSLSGRHGILDAPAEAADPAERCRAAVG
ncbi:HWE histidine kinase domain-containing protein [Paracraurococcus lichenis]|uniref:histidine kinase n=1 Tax=Paracraurococcus lichenis TaxID=3064888 RepID=A0ABT9DVG6_9PROT|nr:HWE histidine kinase domain-containing protein [Paracraurococcus sp. LOR1-02]MDO9707892.1 HWE histidine kinase domain-containing protein [Paracraurococcus sp. LOR1-02]